MLDYRISIVIAASALNISGSAIYAWDTMKGQTQPNRITYVLWALAPLIGTAAMLAQGAGWAAFPIFASGFGPLLILIASFLTKQAHWQLRPFDYTCGVFSLLALLLWRLTHDANIAITFAIISDGLACLPTIRKSWTHPETETAFAYWAALPCVLSPFIVMKGFNFAEMAFPIYLICALSIILSALYRKKICISIKAK